MASLDFVNFEKHLSAFDFPRLFVDVLGWNHAPANRDWQQEALNEAVYEYRAVAELGGVVALQVVMNDQWPDEATRLKVWRNIARAHAENVLIFTDRKDKASHSQWYWVKREKDSTTGKPKLISRRHDYFRGQPVDLFASKLQAMVVELSELDETGRVSVLEAARRIQAALDVEKTTKKFFNAYQQQHLELLAHIKGIDDERDKRWYASVLLNRLMFVWFMQKKLFLDGGNADYLRTKLTETKARGSGRFFGEFLNALFFEAFAKPEADRSATARKLTGTIPYLNGGLFLHHKLELDENRNPRVGTTLTVADAAFEGIFNLFASFTWHLDDTPGGDSDEINPDVLGYIFEKYINQKAFGAYYTRPEITGYLAERSIHKLILERVYAPAIPELGFKEIKFDTVADLLARMDTHVALKLVKEVLPSITILDPAVGSGAFLVAALKCMINVYYAVVGRAELGASNDLQNWLREIQREHPSVGYYIKRCIVTDNLYGVDIMEEACEIAKLRLFLAMVASVRNVLDLEPLPNIDFNIIPGNSLVGLMRIDEQEFNSKQDDLFKPRYRDLVAEKNRDLVNYRKIANTLGASSNLRVLRDGIDAKIQFANGVMNELLRDRFEALGVKFEQATWDAKKKALGKPVKRRIEVADIAAQTPFHWGYVFDDIVQRRGGFDIILANPPWEVFKPQAKEFFAEYSDVVSKNKMTIKEFEKEQGKLLQTAEVRDAWLSYESRFPHMSGWFRAAPEYKHQSAIVAGKKTGSDLNLYKLFVERAFDLLRPGGECGIVIPSGIYTDLGAKGLRDLLFEHTQIQGLFCFENRKEIFEGVHRSFKFVVLTFEKSVALRVQVAGETNASAPPNDLLANAALATRGTQRFPAAFMRHDVAELDRFPAQGSLWLDVPLIKRLSPDSHSVMEFKSELDIEIAKKMLRHPLLGERMEGAWNLVLGNEFHMTGDSKLFKTASGPGRLPLYEGKMIHQFESGLAPTRYWVDANEGRSAILGKGAVDSGQVLAYQRYRFAYRAIARNTDSRTLISTVLPADCFFGHSMNADKAGTSAQAQLLSCALLNSYCFDYFLRQMVTANLTMFFLYQCPVPRESLQASSSTNLIRRAARLICTTPDFDDLAKSVGLRSHKDGAIHAAERAQLRAELDGLVAHLYGLTETEFAHILKTFPLVPDPVRAAAQNAHRDVARGLIA
ncbi:MAG TPA: ATP-binding protein [Casimicrobium sp.]|nr:ATP-binding protein [Casimicrobium sp.]